MIIWTGAGILVVLLPLIGWSLGYAAGGSGNGVLGGGMGLVVSAAALWIAGKRLNGLATRRVLFDPKTGEQVVIERKHTLFWIKMEWWAVPVALGGVAFMILQMATGETHF